MASQFGTLEALNGIYKVRYAKNIESFLPKSTLAQQTIKFETATLVGQSYNFPVMIQTENGATYNLGNNDTPVEANVANSLVSKEAVVLASDITLESAISYKAAERGRTSEQAFENTVGLKMKENTVGLRKALELSLWAGQTDLGTGVGTPTALSANSATVILSGSAPGFWNASVGQQVVFYAATTASRGYDGTVSRTKSQTGLEQSAASGLFTVKSFVPNANGTVTLTLSGHATDITALTGTAITGEGIYRYGTVEGSVGTQAWRACAGFEKILTNNGSLFSIDASQYDAWKATQVALSAAPTVTNILDGVAQAWSRGLEDDMILFVHPQVFSALEASTDVLGKRQFDSSYRKMLAEVGVQGIEISGLNGVTTVTPSQFCKRDVMIGIVPKYWSRIGSTDFTLVNPGGAQGNPFYHSETKNAVAFRSMTDQSLVCKRPMTAGVIFTSVL